MANEIKKIHVGTTDYALCDEYARQRIEGLATIYSISCDTSYTSSYTYYDYDTEATVAFSAMTVMNSKFKSTAKDVTISASDVTAGTNAYIVLLITKGTNQYYVKKLTNLTLGDTIYVKEDATVCADRWLSAWTESPLSGTFTALDAKIDLNNYVTKDVGGKAGTYITSSSGATTTSEAGSHTAAGSVSITYKKSNTSTGSSGAHTHSVSASGIFTPGGSISGSQSISAHNHTTTLTSATVTYVDSVDAATGSSGAHTHSVTGKVTAAGSISNATTGTINYTPAGSINVVVDSHTYTPAGTISGTDVADHTYTPEGTVSAVSATSHSHTVSTHEHNPAQTVVTGYPSFSGGSLTGTKTFNTDAIKEIELAASTVTTDGPEYVESVTHTPASLTGTTTFVTSITGFSGGSLTGTKTFNTDAIKDVTLSGSTVTTDGPKYIEDVTHTDPAFNTTNVVTGYSSFNGGTFTQGSKASFTQGSKASLSYTARSDMMSAPTVTTESDPEGAGVLKWTLTTADDITGWTTNGSDTFVANGNDSFTPASLGAASTVSVLSSVKTNGSISKTTRYMKKTTTAAGTGTVGFTAAALGTQNKGTVGISGGGITPITKYMGHSVTAASTGTVGFTSAALGTASTASVAGTAKTKTITSSSAGSFSVTPTFTGTTATLEHTVTQPTFTGSTTTLTHTVSTKSFTGTGARLVFTGSQVDLTSGTAVSAGAHTHSIGSSTASFQNVTAVAVNNGGGATVDFTKATFTGTSATVSVSGTAASAGAHTHSITLTDTTVSGNFSIPIGGHTHTIDNHTHSVTIPNCVA